MKIIERESVSAEGTTNRGSKCGVACVVRRARRIRIVRETTVQYIERL